MSAVCPDGHSSQTTDYCDQCGLPIDAAGDRTPVAVPPQAPASAAATVVPVEPEALEDEDTSPASRRAPCARCGASRSGDDRFCEACGYDFETPPAGPGSTEAGAVEWEAVAHADREQFERFAGNGLSFPVRFDERRFALQGPRLRIGRSRGADETKPEIDLAGRPEDPAISRLHAALERQADGSYAIRDLGSTNGTMLNDEPQPIAADIAVRLSAGDRIRIGAWTTITILGR